MKIGGGWTGIGRGAVIAVTLAATAAGPLAAQQPSPAEERRHEAERQRREAVERERARGQLEIRVQERMEERIREAIGVSDAEFQRVREVLHEYRVRRVEMAAEERILQMRIVGQPRGVDPDGGREMLPEAEARQLLESLVRIRHEEARLFEEEQEDLLGILSAPQVVRLHLARRAMGERIQRMRRGGGPDGPGRRRPDVPRGSDPRGGR